MDITWFFLKEPYIYCFFVPPGVKFPPLSLDFIKAHMCLYLTVFALAMVYVEDLFLSTDVAISQNSTSFQKQW